MAITEDKVKRVLERLGKSLSDGDLEAVARHFEYPALILADSGSTAIADGAELQKMFAQAVELYRREGIARTHPEIQRFEALSEKSAAVDVRWPGFDAKGNEKSSEQSHYVITLADDAQPLIRLALTRTVPIEAEAPATPIAGHA
jgi:hypothetical protein